MAGGMQREAELTFQGALKILGRSEHAWLKKLDNVLGGAILIAGAGAGIAAVGSHVLAPAGMFAAVWGWVEQKGVAIDLLEQVIAKVSKKAAGTRGYERRQLIASAHTTIVVAAFFEALKEEIGPQAFVELDISSAEKEWLVSGRRRGAQETVYEFLYTAEIPAPSAVLGFEENVTRVRRWNHAFAERLSTFFAGLVAADKLSPNWPTVITIATERYQSHFLSLAKTVPDFMIWASLHEHAATRASVVSVQADVAKLGTFAADTQITVNKITAALTEMRAEFAAALNSDRNSLGRIEALLALDAPTVDALPPLRLAVQRANGGILDESIIPAASNTYAPDIMFPTIGEIYIDPRYRVAVAGPMARLADDRWWEEITQRDDFDLMLAGYAVSADATRVPMLVLGHPGAGKSAFTKILAARLPSSTYTVVRVPLRRVGANAPLVDQIQEALDLATNRRVEWWRLADQSKDTVRVVLLDGLDELLQASQQDRSGYLQEVLEFQRREAEQQLPVIVIVTSRTVVADRVTIPRETVVLKLDPFNDDDIADWLAGWNRINSAAISARTVRELTVNAALSQPELAQQPLLLLMLALYAADPNLPSLEEDISAAELYRRLLEGFARREVAKDPAHDMKPGELEKRVQDHLYRLAVAALAMFNRGRQDIGEEELGSDLVALNERSAPSSRPGDAGRRIIAEFFFVHAPEARMLSGSSAPAAGQEAPPVQWEQPRRAYEFLHATFGEYLVAKLVMDELIDVADKAFASRRGIAEPDGDLIYALLCHQPLAVRGSTLDFMREICASLDDKDQRQLLEVLEMLLSRYRNRGGSNKYSTYQPTPPDVVRQLACYSANLVTLRVILEPDSNGVPLRSLLRDVDDSLEQWRSMVLLWKSALDADGLQSILRAIELASDPLRIIRTLTESGDASQLPIIASEISLNRLINDQEMEERLRYGYAFRRDLIYYNSDECWAAMMTSWLVPAITGIGGNVSDLALIKEPPPGTSDEDISEVARLVFMYLRSPREANRRLREELVRLIFSLPPVFDMDKLALVKAVLEDSDLPHKIPQLSSPQVYGRYAKLTRRSKSHEERQEINFRRLPNLAVSSIQEILLL
jgi:hypothetical protein